MYVCVSVCGVFRRRSEQLKRALAVTASEPDLNTPPYLEFFKIAESCMRMLASSFVKRVRSHFLVADARRTTELKLSHVMLSLGKSID